MRTYLVDTLRGLAAAGVFLAAVVHLDLWDQGFRSIATIGPLFMLDFVAGTIIGIGVLVWRHWLPTLAAAGFGAATAIAFWISVIHGLFGVKETATGTLEVLAQVAEYGAAAFGIAAALLLFREWLATTHSPSRSAPTQHRPALALHTRPHR